MNGCWRCRECGYLYDPSEGDPDSRVPADTPFEQLPDFWSCPVCSETRNGFEPMA